jgi:cyclic peptide transporter
MLFFFIKKFKGIMLISGSLSMLSALASLSLFHLIGNSGEQGFTKITAALYGGLWLFLLCSSMLTSYALSFFTSKSIKEVRKSLVDRILQSDFMTLEKAGRSKLYNVLTNDVNAISSALAEMPAFIYNVILLVACFGYLFYLSPFVFAVLISTIIISAFFTSSIMKKIGKNASLMRANQDDMFEGYKGMLEGAKQLSLNAARKQHYVENNLDVQLEKLKESERRYGFSWDINRNISQSLIFLVLGVVVATSQFMQTSHLVISYVLILTYLAGPFGYVMGLWQSIIRAKVSLQKIESLDIAVNNPNDKVVDSSKLNTDWQSINFKDIGFQYAQTDNQFVVSPVNLQINKGEVIFITGGNGSGKSTFLHVLLGLYKPTSGQISVNDMVLNEGNIKQYVAKMAIVLPDFYLYKTLLNENGKEADNEAVQTLLERFDLQDKVECDQYGYKYVDFSMGQRKRLALISAILEDKDIYVLDEWAADQDPHFRHVFYTQIIPWLKAKGKTIIAVTHDDKYFDCADRRLKFDLGEMQEIPVVHSQTA